MLHLIGQSYQRGFYCDDTSIRYPFKDSTVTNVMLYIYSMGLPIVSMVIVEVVRWRDRKVTGQRSASGRQNYATSESIGSLHVPQLAVELSHLIAIFLFGAGCSQLATDFGKYTIGRLRPHFLDVCKPDLSTLCTADDPFRYVTDFECRGTDAKKLRDARLSFPSGHASFSAYTMLYLALYLQRRMNWSGSHLLRPTLQIAAIMLSWYTGLTRVSDYKHHWSDVLAGFLIGSIAAALTALYVSPLFKPARHGSIPLLPQSKADIELEQGESAGNTAT